MSSILVDNGDGTFSAIDGVTLVSGAKGLQVNLPDLIYSHQEELLAPAVEGLNDNDVIYTSPAGIQEYDCFLFQQIVLLGAIDIQVKMTASDTDFSDPVSLVDLMVANPLGVRVLVTTGIVKRYALLGKFYQIQVSQNGANPSNIAGAHCIAGNGV